MTKDKYLMVDTKFRIPRKLKNKTHKQLRKTGAQ